MPATSVDPGIDEEWQEPAVEGSAHDDAGETHEFEHLDIEWFETYPDPGSLRS